MALNPFIQASGYNKLGACAANAYGYEFGYLGILCDVPASQCVSTICADSATNWLAGMSDAASEMGCQPTDAASASVVFSNLCDANGVVIAATTEQASLPSTTVNVLLASPAASLATTTPIQTASFLSTSILPVIASPTTSTPTPTPTPTQTQSTVPESTSKNPSASTPTSTTPTPSTTSNGSNGGNQFDTSTILEITLSIVGAIGTIAGAWYAYKMYKGWEQRRKGRGGEAVEMA